MLFYTPQFLIFTLILFACLAIWRRRRPQKLLLLAASYIFYMWWNPAFILLIVFSTAVDFFVGRRLERESRPARRKLLLILSLTANLGLLGIFKYANFFAANMYGLLRLFGYQAGWSELNIILPVGISFYTFQTLSYTIDVYRGQLKACRDPLDFALFVAFFPQLVAGPIVRASDFLPQINRFRPLRFDRYAFFLFARGLIKKVLIADNVAHLADAVFSNPGAWPSLVIWLATVCFYVQIYCDFSGYSDMAIALARVLGFRLPENFRRPYFSTSPSEFWRRWHISLSTWLRDYLYIPLGGNRHGPAKTRRNLMITMLLGGLWHGASWNFVLWGFLHGLALIVHRQWRAHVRPHLEPYLAKKPIAGLYHLGSWAALQYWVLLTWLVFRVSDTSAMLTALRKFVLFDADFNVASLGLGALSVFSTLLFLFVFFLLHGWSERSGGLDRRLARAPLWLAAPVCVLIGASLFFFWPLAEAPFIYFQF
ncbi:MBOAT family protein [Thermostilla marina]